MKNQETLLLKFMESSIEKIYRSLANIYAIEEVLIEKGIVTHAEMMSKIRDAESLPERKVGMKVLEEMVNDFKKIQKENT